MRGDRPRPPNRNSYVSRLLWNVPVGVQLSVIYAVLVAATLALLGWALYAQLDNFLVQNTADRVRRVTDTSHNRPLPPHTTLAEVAGELVQDLGESGVQIALLDSQGQVVSTSQSTSDASATPLPTPPAGWADTIKKGASLQWITTSSAGERQLVILSPIILRGDRDRGGDMALNMEIVASLGAGDDILNQLRLYILLGIVLGTAIGVVAGLALTRLVLRPLDRMVRTAEAISAGDLNRRLRLPAGRNEVARLGSSFDQMVDRLASALEAQRRFVADASHELRTPLTSLEGLSEMLLMGADQGDTSVIQRSVRSMYKELARLGRLVADLLTLSRLDSTTPVTLQPLDVSKLIVEVADQMRPLAEARQVNLSALFSEPVIVQGESDKLKQVLINLVDNAIRYTPPDGHVELSATREPSTGAVRIDVTDTGTGIAPEDQARIFDRFYRADLARTRANGNTGLGLAIAQAIVQAHGGAIGVTSVPGAGSRFTVTLPGGPPAEHSLPIRTRHRSHPVDEPVQAPNAK
jgi:two-component system OmpR family sensor kinase